MPATLTEAIHLVSSDSAACHVIQVGAPRKHVRILSERLTIGPCDVDPERQVELRRAWNADGPGGQIVRSVSTIYARPWSAICLLSSGRRGRMRTSSGAGGFWTGWDGWARVFIRRSRRGLSSMIRSRPPAG